VNDDLEVADDRAHALLKMPPATSDEEKARAEAEQRSAQVTLAGQALIAADGDKQAAAVMLREALECTGFIEYEPGAVRTAIGRRSGAARKGQP